MNISATKAIIQSRIKNTKDHYNSEIVRKADSKGWVLLMLKRDSNGRLYSLCQCKDNEWCSHLVLRTYDGVPYFEQGDYINNDQMAFDEFCLRAKG